MFYQSKKIAALVLFCSYTTSIFAATTCDAFKKDVSDAQAASRNADIAAANAGFTNIQNAASMVKKACMDQIVAADVSSFGLGAIGTKMIMNAASQVCDAAAQKAGSYQQQANNAVNGKIDGAQNSLPAPVRQVINPGTTSSYSSPAADAWSKLRQMIN